jgi:uncharacterized protein YbaR (Trm112 family)
MHDLPKAIRDLIVCPSCHGELIDRATPAGDTLDCANCRVRFPVLDGIPVLLTDRAERVAN